VALSQQLVLLAMDFPDRLAALRKNKGLTQQALADSAGVHVAQIRRYEAGDSQPTLDVIRKLAIALSASADMLVFDKDERGPDDELKLQFEAVCRLEPEERNIIKELIEGMIIKYESRRWNKVI
jgi:transcriptional regulator with XRE-family HTH domain